MNGEAPRRHAAALAYDAQDAHRSRAPRVVAKGQGLVADEILERARAAGVPIHESRELASLLAQVDLDQHIPPALYVAVAEVLAWVYRLEGRTAPSAWQGALKERTWA
jgi:flagellar biosynthesis protein